MKRKRAARRSAPELSDVRLPMKRKRRGSRSAPEVSNVRPPVHCTGGEQRATSICG